ncbi:unnamed protein product [Rotaria magnacalcarata]|uniref:RRM domain-containing protein n=1 Tax=Rotaria magnacalcarata TaxID=392030 RepID=A0A814ZGV7_9BILA|nr:unnamed protein product [Rotaria magnacalcarata]CAF2005353.1 unnamed protein product [Rotaria magnacalcarata]CAF2066130.1 unnamed protein product [Rotaria magnacalcarata]CAF2104524.1 unnamed protein product [Rotaria magnacalcarata]CAF3846360.1 unnamed protein product [Rotaria magnacalcarata]
MNSRQENQKHPLVVIHNVTTFSNKQIEQYCKKYDKDIRCFRKRNRNNHEYVHVLFSSIISANNFLNDRPHFIQNCRINTSLVSDPLCGPKFVCVQIDKYASITEDNLYEYTSKHFGRILNCVLYDSRGYAFIEFHQLDDTHRALASSVHQLNGCSIQYCPRNKSSKILPLISLTRLIHIGNFLNKDQENLPLYFPNLQNFSIHKNCYGQKYILGIFNLNDSIKLLLKRAFCLNGRVLNIFMDNDDALTECNNYLLVRNVSYRLNDYNLLEYFSQYGRILNCYRYGQTDAYRIQYRDKSSLNQVIEFNRIHVIKSIRMQIEREKN